MKIFVEREFGRVLMVGLVILLLAATGYAQDSQWLEFSPSGAQKGVSPALGISASANPTTVLDQGVVDITVSINNASGGDVTTFQLDGNVSGGCCVDLDSSPQVVSSTVNGSADQTWTCSGFSTFSCVPMTGSLPQGNNVFVFSLFAFNKGGGLIDLTLTDPAFTANNAATSFVVLGAGGADLAITSAVMNPVSPAPLDPVNVEVTVSNVSATNATNDFQVQLGNESTGFTLPTTFSDTNFSCVAGMFGGLDCDYVGPGLFAGGQVVLSVPATAPNNFGGPFSVDSLLFDTGNSDTISGPGPVQAAGDTSATLMESTSPPQTDPVPFGGQLVYTASVSNVSGATARNVVYSLFGEDDQFSGTVQFISGTGTNWTCMEFGGFQPRAGRAAQKGKFSFGVDCTYGPDLPVGQTAPPVTITLSAPDAPGVTQFSATPAAFSDNSSPGSSPSPIITGVAPTADMSLAKSAPATVQLNSQFDYTLTVTNNGPNAISGGDFSISDSLPSEVSYVSFTSLDYSCSESAGLVDCFYTATSPPDRPNGTIDTILITVQANAVGNAVNNASVTVTSPTIDPNGANDSDSVAVNITPPDTDLSMTKTASVTNSAVGNQFTYDLIVANNGPLDIDKALYTITDSLPPEVNFVSAGNPSYTCVESTGVVTCNYTDSPDTLLNGGSDTITLTVMAASPGNASNLADVAPNSPFVDSNGANNADTADVVIAGSADLGMTKTASVANVNQGSNFTYTLTVDNAGPNEPPFFTVTDTLPPEVSFNGFTAPDFNCTEANNVVTCDYTGTGLLVMASTSIDIDVTAQVDGTVNNTASVAITAPDVDPNSSNDSDSISVVIDPQADLSLTKLASVSSPTVGDQFVWTLDVLNNGPGAAGSFTVTDTLPAQTSFASFAAPDFTCTASGQTVTCDWANRTALGSGINSQIDLTVNTVTPGTANNTATVSADATRPDLVPSNNADSSSVTINALPMTTLVTTVTDSPDPAAVGGNFQISASIFNQGPSTANNLFASFFLDPSVTYNSASFSKGLSGWTCFDNTAGGGQKGTITIINSVDCTNPGPLLTNDTTVVTIDLTAPTAPGVVSTDIEVGSDEFGPANVTETTGIGQDVDLEVVKTASALQVDVDQDFSYAITVTNNTGAATGVTVADTISPDLRVISVAGQEWNCQQFQNTYQCAYSPAVLLAGDTTSALRFNVQAVRSAVIDNTARVSSDQSELVPGNNSDTVTVTVGNAAAVDLALTKASLPTTVLAGQDYQYVLTVENNGTSQASGVVINDQLPAGVQFVSAMGNGWTCADLGGGFVQCNLASTLLPATEVPPSSVTLNVTAPFLVGDILNTADVASDDNDTDTSDNRASASTTIMAAGPAADLSIAKSVDRSSARRGDLLTYNIDVVNLGPETATGIRIDDSLPVGFTVRDVTAPNWDCMVTSGSVACNLMGDLALSQSAGIVLTGVVTATSGQLTNRVDAFSDSFDPMLGNNRSMVDTTVSGDALPADLGIELSDSVDPVLTGDPFDYLITLSNDGPGGATDFAISGVLPTGIIPGAIVGTDLVDCAIEGNQFVCRSVGTFPPNEDRLITFSVTAPNESANLSFSLEVQNTGLGIDANPTNNTDTEQTTVRLTPTAEELRDRLISALSNFDDPLVTDNLSATANLCADPPLDLIDICRAIADALEDGRGSEVAAAIRQLVGAPALTQQTSLVEAFGVQANNMFTRFTQNRQSNGQANAGTLNIDGLSFRYGNEMLPLSLLDAESEEPTIDSAGLVKPWAFFINGTISGGDKDPTTREVGFDFDTRGLTVGVDYRFTSRFIGGVALGYSRFDSDIQGGGVLETDGLTLHTFASYYPTDRFYIDALLSFGSLDFDQRRPISFTLGNLVVQEQAAGRTESDQFSGAFAAGYNFNRGGWNITPSGSVSFMNADIDAFAETGTSLALNYSEQNVESLILSANLNVTRVISLTNGILTPTFDVSYHHESQNDKDGFNSTIVGGAANAAFLVDGDEPDRNFGSAGLGVVFVAANGKQAFLSYRNVLGLSGFSRWTVNAGIRFEF